MKIAIIGSRTFNDYNLLKSKMQELNLPVTKVISGAAQGADKMGVEWAKENGIEYQEFPADWDNLEAPDAVIRTNKQGKKYNANAGFKRNKDIVDNADVVVAFWDMESNGTRDSLRYAKQLGKRWFVVPVNQPAPQVAPQPALIPYASTRQKEKIINLLNHECLTRREKADVLVKINKLTEEQAVRLIEKLDRVIEERTEYNPYNR